MSPMIRLSFLRRPPRQRASRVYLATSPIGHRHVPANRDIALILYEPPGSVFAAPPIHLGPFLRLLHQILQRVRLGFSPQQSNGTDVDAGIAFAAAQICGNRPRKQNVQCNSDRIRGNIPFERGGVAGQSTISRFPLECEVLMRL